MQARRSLLAAAVLFVSPVLAHAAVAPNNVVPPAIGGMPAVGGTLNASAGSWAGSAPITFSYGWLRCDGTGNGCVSIAGATGQTYTVEVADAGRTLRVVVTAKNAGGSTTATSAPVLVAATTLQIGVAQSVTVSGREFLPFDASTNAAFKEMLAQNRGVGVWITNFSGAKLKIAPAADRRAIGKRKKITGNTTLAVAFRKAHELYGLSLVPKGTVSFTVMLQPFAGRPCASPVKCQDDCGGNLGKCCAKDANDSEAKICVQVGRSSCGCRKK
jgi:hypothetical protein